jgi:adenylate cyclase
VRITAQLVNTNNGYHLWSEKYDRDMEDIFAIQDEISLAIVDKLKVELLVDEKAKLVKRYTENQEAHNLYLKGLYFWNRQHEYGYLKSMEYFQQAIEQDALYALPYAGIANAFTFLGLYGFLPAREAYLQARSAALKALDIDDTLAEVHHVLAKIHFWFEWNWVYADKEFKRSIELKPNFALALMEYSVCLALMGKKDESIEKAKRAHQLDPLSLYINALLGCVLFITRRYDEALEQIRRTIEMDENYTLLYFYQGVAYVSKGVYQEAVGAFRKLLSLTGEVPFSICLLGSALGPAGQKDEALKML